MNILIYGYGNIGKHMEKEFIGHKNIDITLYDKYIKDINDLKLVQSTYYDIAFICVPTDTIPNSGGALEDSIVSEAVGALLPCADVIVIKSTVPLGYCDSIKVNKVVYSPEYYGTTIHSYDSPNFLVLSGNKKYCDKVANLYHMVKNGDFKITFTDYKTAEVAKFMENSFLGLKVTFCAEFFDICQNLGISYNGLREIFVLDERMGNSHTYINPEQPYYDSHCLNKDIPAIISSCNKLGINVPLLKTMNNINISKKGI